MANFPTSPSVNDEFETNKVTYVWNAEAWEIAGSGSGGAGGGGNVVGPSSAVDNMIVTFDGTTGKILQDSGVLLSGLATSAHTHGINDLTDVDTSTTAPTDGQALVWDNANSTWEPGTVSGGGGGGSFNPDAAVVFNDSGNDVDFRIESDTNENAFIVNGESGYVGIGADPGTQGNFGIQINNPADSNVGLSVTNSTCTSGGAFFVEQKAADNNSLLIVQMEDSEILIANDMGTVFSGGTWGGVALEFTTTGFLKAGTPSLLSGTAANEKLTIDGAVSLEEMTAPSATAGFAKLYAKDVSGTSKMFVMDGSGTETEVGSGGGGGGGGSIDALSDVDTSTTSPTNGQALLWDASNSQWEPASISGGNSGFTPDGAVVFNESGNAVDFRIESDGNENAFFVKGQSSTPMVGIGTNNPGHALHLKTTASADMCGIQFETSDSTNGGVLVVHHSNDSAGPNNSADLSFGFMNTEDSDISFATNALPFFSGSSSGVGATMSLNRNGNIGVGQAVADYMVGGTSTDLLPKETLDVDGAVTFREMTAPSATTGHAKLYSKDVSGTSKMFAMDSAGTETEVGGGGGGGSFNPDGAVVFNESGADVDFRIESDTIEHAFFVNGETGLVSIGEDTSGENDFGLYLSNPADANVNLKFKHAGATAGGVNFFLNRSNDQNSFVMGHLEDAPILMVNDVATMMSGGTWGGVGLEFTKSSDGGNIKMGTPSMFGGTLPNETLTVSGAVSLEEISAPSATANFAKIYAKEVAGSAEMFVLDEGGNETQISPHNPDGEWQYFSRNISTGKVVRVNMERMIRDIEELTGKTYIEEE